MFPHSPAIFFFFFNDTATTEIYTLSLHDALPIYFEWTHRQYRDPRRKHGFGGAACSGGERLAAEKGSREFSRQPFSNSRLWRFQAARLQPHHGSPRQEPPPGNPSCGL